MDRITPTQLRELAEKRTAPCVSIYLPTHRKTRETQGDSVRLKNLLKSAEDQLIEREMRPTLARDMLEPARLLLDDEQFWMYSSDAMAIFIAPEFFRLYRLPMETDDLSVVNDRFYTKPLLPLLEDDVFHILAMSLNSVRLLECTPHRVDEIKLPDDVATAFGDAIGGKDHHVDRAVWRQGGGTSSQNQIGDAHGHGPDQDNEMLENLAFFMRQLDEGVNRAIGDETVLLVAGAESTAPHYFKVTKRKNLVRDLIAGNPEHVEDEVLRDKGLEIVGPMWEERLKSEKERFGNAKAQGIASSDVVQVVRAATEGRVDTLFVTPSATVWGEFDEEKMVAVEKEGGSEDLVELAIRHALNTGARLVVTEADSVPGDREAAAIFRY